MGYYAATTLPDKTAPLPENRVGVFSAFTRIRAGRSSPQPIETQQGKPPTLTEFASGVRYYGLRYYNSELGRWVSRDPIEKRGGVNVYGFVGNGPIVWVDMLGLWTCEDLKKLIGCRDSEVGKGTLEGLDKLIDDGWTIWTYDSIIDDITGETVSGVTGFTRKDSKRIYLQSNASPEVLKATKLEDDVHVAAASLVHEKMHAETPKGKYGSTAAEEIVVRVEAEHAYVALPCVSSPFPHYATAGDDEMSLQL